MSIIINMARCTDVSKYDTTGMYVMNGNPALLISIA